jgi:hypothetical protein
MLVDYHRDSDRRGVGKTGLALALVLVLEHAEYVAAG